MKTGAFSILIIIIGMLLVACGCSQQQIANNTGVTVTTVKTTIPVTGVTEPSSDIPFVSITVTDMSVRQFPDHCLWTFRGTLSNIGTGRLNDVFVMVTLIDRRSPSYPTVTNQQQVGMINPGSDQTFVLSAETSCEGDYHASIKYYGKDDSGKLYSRALDL
jgi:hypothetical protein